MSDTTFGSCPSPAHNGVVFVAMNKLTKLVEHHPRLHSKLETMLEEVFIKPAAIRKQKNEDLCPIYKVSNDELKHIF